MYSIAVALILASQASNDREADMFGADAAEPPPAASSTAPTAPAASSSDREGDLFGNGDPEVVPQGMIKDSGILADADDALALGGTLFLRLNSSFREGQGVSDAAVTGASLLDAFADVRPNDRVRAYARRDERAGPRAVELRPSARPGVDQV
jgi:hypothetical protein